VAAAALVVPTVSPVHAATAFRFSGALGGMVTDPAGKPQADAMVLLFNRQNRLLQRSATDALGSFTFADLLPDLYSVQISLANFVPAMREQIQIKPGMRSLLSVSLSKVFSSVQVVSMTPLPGGLMSDTWKWTLRTDDAVRPVLRLLPPERTDSPEESHAAIFTDSRGLIRISASDGVDMAGAGDLGTQFAFATSVYGGNHIAVAGDLGYAQASGAPSAAIRTTFSRDFAGAKPVLSVTMRQFYMPSRLTQSMTGGPGENNQPVLRTMAVSFSDKTEIADSLDVEYGFEMDSVSFGNHLQYFSPYAKLSRALDRGKLDFTWTSGNARPELGMSGTDANADLQRNLTALSVMPMVTLRDGVARVQRGSDYELGLSQRFGSREYRVSAYYDDVANTTLTIATPVNAASGGLFPGDLLPDMMSTSSLFNAGNFQTAGYSASATQDLGDNYHLTVAYGSLGVMAPRSGEVSGTSANDLRRLMQSAQRPALTLQASGTVKCTGTRFVTSYEWTDYRSAVPGPVFTTEPGRLEPGFNVAIRQPIPSIPGVPGRMEASAELRNLLAQGYLPLTMPGGQQLLLVNTARSLRGGLAFIF
jgi:hypothetical protein